MVGRPWAAPSTMLLCLLLLGPVPAAAASRPLCGNSGTPAYTKVMWIVMENISYGTKSNQIPGSPSASYIDGTLVAQCGSTSHWHNATHPSFPNYVALTSGGTQGLNSDHLQYLNVPSIFSQVDPDWKSFQEFMPSPCDHVGMTGDSTTRQYYVGKHNPAASYPAPPVGAPGPDCSVKDLGLGTTASGALLSAITAGLPRFSQVTPGLCNDMHLLPAGVPGCADPIKAGDSWLAKWVPQITSGPDYQSGKLLIDIVWDEGRGNGVPLGGDCTASATPDCIVPNIVVAPFTPHKVSSATYSHYSLLRTTERVLGFPFLGHAADTNTADMCTDFNLC